METDQDVVPTARHSRRRVTALAVHEIEGFDRLSGDRLPSPDVAVDRADLAAGCEIETDRDRDPDRGKRSDGRWAVGARDGAPTGLAVTRFARARHLGAR